MNEKELLSYLHSIGEEVKTVKIISCQKINEEAELVSASIDDAIETSFIIYSDGTVFTPWDWQSEECYCKSPENIPSITWRLDNTEKMGVVVNGLPRVLA